MRHHPFSVGVIGLLVLACAPEYTSTGDTRQLQGSTKGCPADFCKGAKSRCITENDQNTCVCPVGSHEEAGGCKDDLKCAADGSSCSKHGSCAETKNGGLSCVCDSANGYTGATCNECLTGLGFHKSADGLSCTQDACDITPNPCAANADPNRKLCTVDTANKPVCGCNDGYGLNAADTCVVPQACEGRATCSSKGECSVVGTKVTCACDAGYAGALCNTCAGGYVAKGGACIPNPCNANPCGASPNTTCAVDLSRAENYRCDCRFGDGFTMSGANCVCAADAFECTRDIIDGAGKCVHPANTGAGCNDGDGNVCTNGVCNGGGQCAPTAAANGVTCGGDTCNVYQCVAGTCTYYGYTCGGGGDGGGGDGAGGGG